MTTDTIERIHAIGDLPVDRVEYLITHADDWHAARATGIGGSDATRIMSGDWLPLWEQKTGRAEPEDLSGILPVVMGTWTEALNRYWFQKRTGMHVDLLAVSSVAHPEYGFMRANLDGRVGLGIWEAKHVNPFGKPEETREKYYAQCQHNMAAAGAPVCYLSIFFGNMKWEYFEIDEDSVYQAALIEREAEFWRHVVSDTPPGEVGASEIAAVAIDDMREVSMEGNNGWASAAADWTENQQAANKFKKADADLKDMAEPDVRRAFGHGVEIKRSRNGALRIGREK